MPGWLVLAACQSTYPDLRTVPTPPDSKALLEERRQIVRDLIENRDFARHKQAIVRHRSGLSDIEPAATPPSTPAKAEDIVREATVAPGKTAEDDFESEPERAYRDRTKFDDGTLNDFIRRMKRDTEPAVDPDEEDLEDQDPSVDQNLEPLTRFFEEATGATLTGADWLGFSFNRSMIRASLVPTDFDVDALMMAQLVADDADDADESDSGFFCSYLGWMVAWSNACLDDDEKQGDVAAGIDDGKSGRAASSSESNEKTPSGKSEGGVSGGGGQQQQAESLDDGTGSNEDLDVGSSLMEGPLDRLRNLIRSRTRPADRSSGGRPSLADAPTPEELGPPLPRRRPEVEKDLRIVRNDRVYEFTRTRIPAFKPIPPKDRTTSSAEETNESATNQEPGDRSADKEDDADTKAVSSQSKDAEPTKESGTNKVADEEEQKQVASDSDKKQAKVETPDQPSDQKTSSPDPDMTEKTPDAGKEAEDPKDPNLLDSEVIQFEKESTDLPVSVERRLGAMLRKAKSKNGKLYIVSEARLGNLAMERARSVGLALVRQGATADLIEYHLDLDSKFDRVRLELRLDETSAKDSATANTAGQNK